MWERAMTPAPAPFTVANSLAALLSTESLLFAALNVGIAFGQRTSRGTSRRLSGRGLALIAAGLIAVVAVGAAAAWWRIFGAPWRHDFSTGLQALCLLVAIVAEPVVAFLIATNVHSLPTTKD
jgi:hypothetical protein